MKTTALFALIVALLARQPPPHGPGAEEPGAARPSVQQSSVGTAPKSAKTEDEIPKDVVTKPAAKAVEPPRKD